MESRRTRFDFAFVCVRIADLELIATALKILVKALEGLDNFGFLCFRFLLCHVVDLGGKRGPMSSGPLYGQAFTESPGTIRVGAGVLGISLRPNRAARRFPSRIPSRPGLLDY